MGKKWPNESVSASGSILPDKMYTVKVIEGEETESRGGKYAIAIRSRVISPAKFKNRPLNFTFYIGTDDDLEADNEETWTTSFAASRYKSFLMAAEVVETGDIEEELEEAGGKRLVVDAGHHEDAESGRKYQDVNAFYKEGEQEESETDAESDADDDAYTKSKTVSVGGKKQQKPVLRAPAEEEEVEEEEAPPPKKAAKGKVTPKGKKASKDDDWD